MDLAELRQQLVGWLEEIKSWNPATDQSWENYIFTDAGWRNYMWSHGLPANSGMGPPEDDVLHVHLFTSEHEYHIHARPLTEDRPTGSLSAYAHNRKKRAGEQWTRMNDLPDGPLTRQMWDSILKAVLRWELIAKVKASEGTQIVDESLTLETQP